jgi:hypothetical protein
MWIKSILIFWLKFFISRWFFFRSLSMWVNEWVSKAPKPSRSFSSAQFVISFFSSSDKWCNDKFDVKLLKLFFSFLMESQASKRAEREEKIFCFNLNFDVSKSWSSGDFCFFSSQQVSHGKNRKTSFLYETFSLWPLSYDLWHFQIMCFFKVNFTL